MVGPTKSSAAQIDLAQPPPQNYGLRREILSPMETLAQSISTIAPTATPAATIPLVCALAGNGTWLAYVLATMAILVVAWCVGRFARYSSSPGSLYSYASMILPTWLSSIAAWSLLLAYVATASSVIGGLYQYAAIAVGKSGIAPAEAVLISLLVTGASVWIAWRDVKISARLMLWIEATSMLMIITLVALVLVRHGFHVDTEQLHLRGMTGSGLRLGLVLALFSFVGFESATTLGYEARNPLRTIPRAVVQCAVLSGAFFILCSYSEVLGFHGAPTNLADTNSPLHILATKAGVSALGVGIDCGALISMFACVLACTTAAARVMLRMSHAGLLPHALRSTSRVHGTPGTAIVLSATLMFIATAVMAYYGIAGFDMYDLAGSLSVFGFLTAYALVALAVPFAERSLGKPHFRFIVLASAFTVLVIVMIAVFDIRSSSDPAHARIPYLYLAYIVAALAVFFARRKAHAH